MFLTYVLYIIVHLMSMI